jgi:hypothetical protein
MKPLPDPGDSGVQSPPEAKPAEKAEAKSAEKAEAKPAAEAEAKPAPAPEPAPEPEPAAAVEPAQPEAPAAPATAGSAANAPAGAKEKPVSKTESAAREVELSEPVPTVGGGLGAEAMRTRLVDDPELVEPGLAAYRDPKTGAPAGAQYDTDVGSIDLLAEGADGALVVVMVAEAGGDPVGPVLEQLGWVSKHMAEDDRAVRAIVLLEPPPPELGYAARAVADSVAFKTWRVAIAVDDVEL